MNLKLYEISDTLMKIMQDIEQHEDNEARQAALQEALADWGDALDEKIGSIAGLMVSLRAEAAAFSEVAKAKADNAKRLMDRANWLEGYAIGAMKRLGRPALTTPEMLSVKIKTGSGAVEINDESQIPKQFIVKTVVESISKTDLRQALLLMNKEGRAPVLPGCRLVFNEKLEIK